MGPSVCMRIAHDIRTYTHEDPSKFTKQYPTKKTLHLISTFSPLVTAQHTTCSNTRLVLLKMGIMMPETCWEGIDNKHLTVASCWFSLSLHNLLTMHGHRNLKSVQRLTEINKLWNIASCWLYSENILMMHGPINVRCTYKTSWGWTLGCSKHAEDTIIKTVTKNVCILLVLITQVSGFSVSSFTAIFKKCMYVLTKSLVTYF